MVRRVLEILIRRFVGVHESDRDGQWVCADSMAIQDESSLLSSEQRIVFNKVAALKAKASGRSVTITPSGEKTRNGSGGRRGGRGRSSGGAGHRAASTAAHA